MNINGVIFLTVTNLTFQNMYAVIYVFSDEMCIFIRESRSKLYQSSSYFLGKTTAELPIYMIIPILYISILWPMVNLNMDSLERFTIATCVLVLISQVATSFGYFISCISGNIQLSLSIGPVVVVPFMLMGGFFLNHKTVPTLLQFLPYMSWFLYGNEALMVNVWDSVKDGDIACDAIVCMPNGKEILARYGFDKVYALM